MGQTPAIDFDQRAKGWDANPAHGERNRAILTAFGHHLALDGTLSALELGCGTGELALGLAPSLASVLATDASAGMIEQFAAKLAASPRANVRAVCFDLLGDESLTETFDLVYSAMMLHHVEDVAGLLVRVAARLRPGGQVALVDLLTEDGSFHGETVVPHLGFSEPELGMLARAAGLRLRSFEVIHAVAKNDRQYPVFLAMLEA